MAIKTPSYTRCLESRLRINRKEPRNCVIYRYLGWFWLFMSTYSVVPHPLPSEHWKPCQTYKSLQELSPMVVSRVTFSSFTQNVLVTLIIGVFREICKILMYSLGWNSDFTVVILLLLGLLILLNSWQSSKNSYFYFYVRTSMLRNCEILTWGLFHEKSEILLKLSHLCSLWVTSPLLRLLLILMPYFACKILDQLVMVPCLCTYMSLLPLLCVLLRGERSI